MRKVSLVLVVAGAIVAGASPAFAVQPTRVFSPASSFVVPSSAAGGPCSFAMNVSFDVDREYVTTFFDQAGDLVRLQIAGHLVETITNANTGESVTLNISGPATIVIDSSGLFHFTSRGAATFFNLSPPFATLFVGHVRLDATLDPTTGIFAFNVLSSAGREVDLCPILS